MSDDRKSAVVRKSLRRLTATDMQALDLALRTIGEAEAELVKAYPKIAAAARRERGVMAGNMPEGPYCAAAVAVRDLVRVLTVAREETEVTVSNRKSRAKRNQPR